MNIFLSYTEYELHLSEVCIFGCSKQTICKLLKQIQKRKRKKKLCTFLYYTRIYI